MLVKGGVPIVIRRISGNIQAAAARCHSTNVGLACAPQVDTSKRVATGIGTRISAPCLIPRVQTCHVVAHRTGALIHLQSNSVLAVKNLVSGRRGGAFEGIPVLKSVPLLKGLFRDGDQSIRRSRVIVVVGTRVLSE